MDWRKLKPEERVNAAIGMVDLVTSISAENERVKHPKISEQALISRLRHRFQILKVTTEAERAAIDRADIKSILENTSINLRLLRKRAKTQKTIKLLDDLLAQLA